MNEYRYFSLLYDELTDEMDYSPWINIIENYKGSLLDVGCGSATLLILLKQLGFDAMGLDLSSSMIEIAKKKLIMNHLDINLIVDNMITFKLDKKFDIISCFFDTLNHLSNEQEVISTLNNLSHHLNDNGVILIDLFTKEKMQDINNLEFIYDEYTYFAKWKMNCEKNKIIHDLEFKFGNNIINEQYIETYFDIKKILPKNLLIIKEIPIIIDNICERIIYVIKK